MPFLGTPPATTPLLKPSKPILATKTANDVISPALPTNPFPEDEPESPALTDPFADPKSPLPTFSLGEIERQLGLIKPPESPPKPLPMSAHFYRTHGNLGFTTGRLPPKAPRKQSSRGSGVSLSTSPGPERKVRVVKKGEGLTIDTVAAAQGRKIGRKLSIEAEEFVPSTGRLSVEAAEFLPSKGWLSVEAMEFLPLKGDGDGVFVDWKDSWECGFCGIECFCEGLPDF